MNKNLQMKIVPIFTILEKDILSVPVKLKLLKTYLKLLKKKKKSTYSCQLEQELLTMGFLLCHWPQRLKLSHEELKFRLPSQQASVFMSWTKNRAASVALCRNPTSLSTLKYSSWNSNLRFAFQITVNSCIWLLHLIRISPPN